MARIARVVMPGMGHYVSQRGVRSINIFNNISEKKAWKERVSGPEPLLIPYDLLWNLKGVNRI